jgi:hypothetical protein
MKEHERTHLETKLKELRNTLTSLADGAGFEQIYPHYPQAWIYNSRRGGTSAWNSGSDE